MKHNNAYALELLDTIHTMREMLPERAHEVFDHAIATIRTALEAKTEMYHDVDNDEYTTWKERAEELEAENNNFERIYKEAKTLLKKNENGGLDAAYHLGFDDGYRKAIRDSTKPNHHPALEANRKVGSENETT